MGIKRHLAFDYQICLEEHRYFATQEPHSHGLRVSLQLLVEWIEQTQNPEMHTARIVLYDFAHTASPTTLLLGRSG